ncbi:ComF family protein [Paenibacillus sp. DMB20]|uniref:ComF family protein n=1 Tax=Paenibacillus sp. DMB20 TaxID=1642570 RepID=UPI001F22A0FE|nr:ComF family protein [Paenibacillus sp. DMB20]
MAQYKYRGNEKFEFLLSRMLTQAYRQMQQEFDDQLRQGIRSQTLAGSGTPMNPYWQAHLVTSVPISESRLRERGFNQAEKLARGLASACRLPYAELLVRARHTDKQSFKGRMDRLKNMEGIFDLSPGSGGHISRFYKEHIRSETLFNPHAPLRILLVDDIYTTGSTVNACSGIIKAAGEAAGTPVEIYSLTWARS